MVKLICDHSFVTNYVENFYSDEQRGSAGVVDRAITPFLKGNPILVIACKFMEELIGLYPERLEVLETVFSICEISGIDLSNKIDTLIKLAAIYEIQDEDTFILSDDEYIIRLISRTTHRAIGINQALRLLEEKGFRRG